MHGASCMLKTELALLKAWDAAHTGLLLSERLVNCPPQLAPPLNQALFDEVTWAQEDEPTQVRTQVRVSCCVVSHFNRQQPSASNLGKVNNEAE